jgi:hypothetical protein
MSDSSTIGQLDGKLALVTGGGGWQRYWGSDRTFICSRGRNCGGRWPSKKTN